MKTLKISTTFIFAFILSFSFAQETNYSSIAKKMVNTSLNVQPGETVVISGTTAELDIMEELYVEVSKAGGKPTIELSIPAADKRAIMQTSMDYLKIPDLYNYVKIKSVDCFINVGSIAEPGLFSDVPEEKFAAIRQANLPFNKVYQNAAFRSVSLGQVGGIPTQAYAQSVGANYDEMLKMFWNAVDTDYEAMLNKGHEILKSYKKGATAKITSQAGTDLTLKIGDSAPGTNCGKTVEVLNKRGPSSSWLPAGEAYVAVDPTSANGTLVIPHTKYRNKDIKNLKIVFKDGKISSMNADSNLDDLKEAMELSSGMKDVLSYMDIGINPNSKPLNGSDYLSFEMAGVITIGIGVNTWTGGDVESDFGFAFFVPSTTLKVENKDLIVNGILQ